jgi:hypothetical protein
VWCVSVGYSWIRRRDLVSDDGLTAVPLSVALFTARCHVDLDGSLFGWTGVHCFWWLGDGGCFSGLTMRQLTVESLSRFFRSMT